MRIVFVIPGLGPGGAERVASLLCSFWSSAGHAVDLVTFEERGAQPFYSIERVHIHQLEAINRSRNLGYIIRTNALRIVRLRRRLRLLRPDIVVAFMTEANVIAICASRGLSAGIVISERNQPDRPGLSRAHRLARRLTYGFADAIVVQTAQIADGVKARFRTPTFVVPNPISLKQNRLPIPRFNGSKRQQLVSVGRLVHQKGFDILIRSYAAVAEQFPGWTLRIYGDGPERSGLEELIRQMRLEDRVELAGSRPDITSALVEATLFVLPSRYEGYPNALLEALACGLPVVASDCPGGIAEILDKGNYGMLVATDDVTALSTALTSMMSRPELRAAYAAKAPKAVAALNLSSIGSRWLDVFGEVMERGKRG